MTSKNSISVFALIILLCLAAGHASAHVPGSFRIYIANDDHTDLFWSGNESEYERAWLSMLDYYLNQADQTENLDPDFQSRFNPDGHYWMWTYENKRTREQFERLIARIKDGHINMPMQTLVLLYGCMHAETVLRSMYYAGRIERMYDVRFEMACAQENHILPCGLPSLWAGAGAKYSWKGVNGWGTDIPNLDGRLREVYYAHGLDGRGVLMKWHSLYRKNNWHSGGYAECREEGPAGMVNFLFDDLDFFENHPSNSVVGFFGWGAADLETTTSKFTQAAQAKSTNMIRVIVSNQVDYFKDLEASTPPENISTYTATFGNDWDGLCAAMAEVTATVKRSVEELRTAEALAAFASYVNPGFMVPLIAERDMAFNNMGLFYEHCWINDGEYASQRKRFNKRKANEINSYVNSLKTRATEVLSTAIPCPAGSRRFCVFNPLSWTRTDFADVLLDVDDDFVVKNINTQQTVPSQIVEIDGKSVLRILAKDIPANGYQVFELAAGTPRLDANGVEISNDGWTMENNRYSITTNPRGAIASLIDKQDGNREWVKIINSSAINDFGSGNGQVEIKHTGPVSACISIDARGYPAHKTEITMYTDIDRIDIKNEIYSNFWGDPPVSYGFGLNLADFICHHEEIGAILTAKLTTHGGHYSTIAAKYDYLTMNHFVDLSGADRGITISNWDSPFFQLGNSTAKKLDISTPLVRAIVGGNLNPAEDFIGGQDNDSYFLNRFALYCHDAYDPTESMQIALEHQNPLYSFWLNEGGENLDGGNYSLFNVEGDGILAWALKPAEEGVDDLENGGLILRVWNVSDETHDLNLHFNSNLTQAYKTTHLETNLEKMTVVNNTITDVLPQQWMQTYRLYISDIKSSVNDPNQHHPALWGLLPNSPNPFNVATSFTYFLDTQANISFSIYNLKGQRITTLIDRQEQGGIHHLHCNAKEHDLTAGTYICRLEVGGNVQTRKMLYIH